jgi:hypothetical protein
MAVRSSLLALGAVCSAQAASAAELELGEPATCITADELAFRVERALGKPLGAAESLQLSARIQPEPAGFGARLEVLRAGQRGLRSLHAATCEEVSEALVVAIVVAIGEGEDAEAAEPRTAPAEPASSPAPADAASPPPSAEPESEAASAPSITGSAWLIADTGTLPATGLGAGVGITLGWPRLQLRAVGTLLPEREGSVNAAAPDSPGASIGLLAGSALGCVPVTSLASALSVAACAGWELGQLSGSGTHVATPYHQSAFWSAARLDLGARWALLPSALSLELLLTAVAPFTRDEFILKDLGSVYRPASLLGRLGLGLGLALD